MVLIAALLDALIRAYRLSKKHTLDELAALSWQQSEEAIADAFCRHWYVHPGSACRRWRDRRHDRCRSLVQLTEGAAAEPVELRPVLVDRPLAVQHHNVVEIVSDLDGVRGRVGAGVGQREVGRASEHGGAVPTVVADEELGERSPG
jgi:hypothetical protein